MVARLRTWHAQSGWCCTERTTQAN